MNPKTQLSCVFTLGLKILSKKLIWFQKRYKSMLDGFDRRKVDMGENKNRMNEKFRVGVKLVSSEAAAPTPITTTTGIGEGGLIGGCKVRPSKQRPSFSAMATKAPNTASLRRGRTKYIH